jgi:hypothetical protein
MNRLRPDVESEAMVRTGYANGIHVMRRETMISEIPRLPAVLTHGDSTIMHARDDDVFRGNSHGVDVLPLQGASGDLPRSSPGRSGQEIEPVGRRYP